MFFSYARSKATALSLCLAFGFGASSSVGAGASLKLHVPSPDWRDQIIYFLMTDRFEDGNPSNNDQGAVEIVDSNVLNLGVFGTWSRGNQFRVYCVKE